MHEEHLICLLCTPPVLQEVESIGVLLFIFELKGSVKHKWKLALMLYSKLASRWTLFGWAPAFDFEGIAQAPQHGPCYLGPNKLADSVQCISSMWYSGSQAYYHS